MRASASQFSSQLFRCKGRCRPCNDLLHLYHMRRVSIALVNLPFNYKWSFGIIGFVKWYPLRCLLRCYIRTNLMPAMWGFRRNSGLLIILDLFHDIVFSRADLFSFGMISMIGGCWRAAHRIIFFDLSELTGHSLLNLGSLHRVTNNSCDSSPCTY